YARDTKGAKKGKFQCPRRIKRKIVTGREKNNALVILLGIQPFNGMQDRVAGHVLAGAFKFLCGRRLRRCCSAQVLLRVLAHFAILDPPSSILYPSIFYLRSSILDPLVPVSVADPSCLCDKSLRLRHFLFERVKKTSRKRFAVQLHGSLGFHPRF